MKSPSLFPDEGGTGKIGNKKICLCMYLICALMCVVMIGFRKPRIIDIIDISWKPFMFFG